MWSTHITDVFAGGVIRQATGALKKDIVLLFLLLLLPEKDVDILFLLLPDLLYIDIILLQMDIDEHIIAWLI